MWVPLDFSAGLIVEGTSIAEYRSADGKFTYQLSECPEWYLLYQTGEFRLDDAKHLAETLIDLSRRIGQRYPVLMPLPAGFRSTEPDARRHMSAVVLAEGSPLSKVAIYGGSFLMRTMFNLFGRVSKVPLRLWLTREEAEAWLRQ